MLIHVRSGMPVRSTEMETYRIVNGSSASRTVFFLNEVFLHCWYSKTRAVRQANRGVSRFLDPEASIVLTDLLVIRPLVIRQTTSRPNVAYTFDDSGRTSNLVRCCAQFVSNVHKDRIIIYVPSVEIMHSVKRALDTAGDVEITSATYSGQQEANESTSNFTLWREGQVKIMVATSAFGIGIDNAHVQQVICFGLCYSVEDYAQMMGRAGRDEEPTVALTLFDRNVEVARSHHLSTTAFDDIMHGCYSVEDYAQMMGRAGRHGEPAVALTLFDLNVEVARSHHLSTTAFDDMMHVCRRRYLARYLDVKETECSHDPLNQSCDTCMQQHGPQGTGINDKIGDEDIFANLPDSVFVDCTHGQNLVCATRDLGEQLWFYLNRFKAMCIVCWTVWNLCEPRH